MYAREWSISMDEITSYFGEIDPANIKFFNNDDKKYMHGERLISSDGSILIW